MVGCGTDATIAALIADRSSVSCVASNVIEAAAVDVPDAAAATRDFVSAAASDPAPAPPPDPLVDAASAAWPDFRNAVATSMTSKAAGCRYRLSPLGFGRSTG